MAREIRLLEQTTEDGVPGRFHRIRGDVRFIPDEVDPAEDVGAIEAALISAGRATTEIPTRINAAFGSELAAAELERTGELFESLETARPVATVVGSAIPGFAVPGGKAVQVGLGAFEGALANPASPFKGAAQGAAFGFVGQRVGDEIAALASRKLQDISGRVFGSASRRAQAAAAQTVSEADTGLRRVTSGPLTVGERTGSRTALVAERAQSTALGRSLRGTRRQTNLNREFDKALGGKGADQLTGDILGEHSSRISSVFEDAAKGVDEIPISQQFSDSLGDLRVKADEVLPGNRAMKQLDIIENVTLGDKMTGEQYLRLRTRLGKMSRAEWSPGGDAIDGEFLDDMITALDDMFAEAAPELAGKLGTARGQWRMLTAIRRGSALDPRGNVNPTAMQGALEKVFPGVDRARFSPGAAGQAQRLNVASQRFPVEASSRTGERLASLNPARQGVAALAALGGGTGGQLGGGLAREIGIPAVSPDDE